MKKVITCILSFIPLVFTVLMTIAMVSFGIALDQGAFYGTMEDVVVIGLFIFIILYLIAVFGIMIYFIVITCKNPNLSTGMKVLWCFLHYQFNAFAFPVYWFIYILRE